MAFNMKGSPAKMGTIKGTKGHTTALKWAQFIPAALSVLGSMGKKKDDNDESPTKQKKTYPKSYTKKDIEFLKKQNEDIVRYEDLDDKGKKMWDALNKRIPGKKSTKKQSKSIKDYKDIMKLIQKQKAQKIKKK